MFAPRYPRSPGRCVIRPGASVSTVGLMVATSNCGVCAPSVNPAKTAKHNLVIPHLDCDHYTIRGVFVWDRLATAVLMVARPIPAPDPPGGLTLLSTWS